MIKAGTKMGINENLSKLFVKQTMVGAYHLINNSDKNLDELIKKLLQKVELQKLLYKFSTKILLKKL
jgi:pyrroline-5-carboxylate reductase